jgi:FAD/FMN-containing dehydrogenase
MAYAHRQTRYTMNIHGRWQKPTEDERGIGWVRGLFNRSAPLSSGSVYINFVPEVEESRKIGPFGNNLSRLRQIKAQVDPGNLFRANVQIEPLGT